VRPFGDGVTIPLAPVLVLEQDERAVLRRARGPADVGEHEQCQEAGHLRVVGQELPQHPRQVTGALDQVGSDEVTPRRRSVTGREDEVHDAEDGVDARHAFADRRGAVGDVRLGDLLLGPCNARRHGGLAHEEAPGDLSGREPADEAEGERDLRGA